MSAKQNRPANKPDAKGQLPQIAAGTLDRLPVQDILASTIVQRAKVVPGSLTPGNILQLQRSIGNKAVNRLLTESSRIQAQPDKKVTDAIEADNQRPTADSSPNRRVARRTNQTGLPDDLKTGVEQLGGVSLDDVKVHYGSEMPAQLNALAYAQGSDIHLAPGQKQHLPHEAWHVVQQKQGRVQPTGQKLSTGLNADSALEREAESMGAIALQVMHEPANHDTRPLSTAGGQLTPVIQRVRTKIENLKFPVTLADLEAAINAYDIEIAQLVPGVAEVDENYINLAKIWKWRGHYDERIQGLRDHNPGNTSFSAEEIGSRDGVNNTVYLILVSLANMRKALNESLSDYTDIQQASNVDFSKLGEEFKSKKEAKALEKDKEELKEKAAARTAGLGNKWDAKYRGLLKRTGQLVFHQYVPKNSPTIQKSLRSQKITDAVFHEGKAFWMADPTSDYKLGSADGKALMVYTFSAEGARSLMEDYLICGSGDFAEDNPETYTGETGHPLFTIWKPNEVGAYGIGQARLEELSQFVQKIEAIDEKGKKIKPE